MVGRRRRKRVEVGAKQANKTSDYCGLAESMFANIVEETFESPVRKISSENAWEVLAKAVRAYVEYANKPILVRRGNKQSTVPCWQAASRTDLEVVSDDDIERHIIPFTIFPDFRVLGSSIERLQEEARKLGLERAQAYGIMKEVSQRRAHQDSKSAMIAHTAVHADQYERTAKTARPRIFGERDKNVAQRRTILRNLLRHGRRRSHMEICKKWDAEEIGVPDQWQSERRLGWVEALESMPNNVHKLISTDISRIRQRSG